MTNLKKKRVLLTGGGGFLGGFVVKSLLKRGVLKKDIAIPRSKDFDLRKRGVCDQLVKNQDVVIHLAATVGGVAFNRDHPAEVFYNNAIMALNLIDSAYRAQVKKFVGVGSVCSYPEFIKVPFREKDLWNGYPEKINAPYGLAKKMMLVQSQTYRQQYGFNAVHLLMVNLYGPGDNFDLQNSHVLPALIKKMVGAKKNNAPFIEFWGTGLSTREFLYVEDAAEAVVLATEKYNKSDPINIGSGQESSIKNLSRLIRNIVDYRGKITWNNKKSGGRPRRKSEISLAQREFGFVAKTNLKSGLQKTINWYLNQHDI